MVASRLPWSRGPRPVGWPTAWWKRAGRTPGTLSDGDFWYATAAKLLAPLLLAAACSGRTMADVVRWIDEQESDEVVDALDTAGQWQALQALRATWGRDERQRSAVYTTAETVVEVFADPAVAASSLPGVDDIDPATPPRRRQHLVSVCPGP